MLKAWRLYLSDNPTLLIGSQDQKEKKKDVHLLLKVLQEKLAEVLVNRSLP